MHYRRRDRVRGNDDSGLMTSLRKEVVCSTQLNIQS
jgi:hypothetical protein